MISTRAAVLMAVANTLLTLAITHFMVIAPLLEQVAMCK